MPDENKERYELLKQRNELLRTIHDIPCALGFHGSKYKYRCWNFPHRWWNLPPFRCEYCGKQNKRAMKKWRLVQEKNKKYKSLGRMCADI